MRFLTAIALGALLATTPDELGFSGVWERDAEESDDAREKMREAMESMRERMRPPGGGGFGGRGRRGGMGPPGGGARGPRGDGPGGGGLGNIPDELSLDLVDEELHFDDGQRLRIYDLDGEKHARETPGGMKLETTAELSGSVIRIEEKMERGETERKLELSPDGATLVMTLTIERGRMSEPVLIRTVYRRAEESL